MSENQGNQAILPYARILHAVVGLEAAQTRGAEPGKTLLGYKPSPCAWMQWSDNYGIPGQSGAVPLGAYAEDSSQPAPVSKYYKVLGAREV
ncbi:hypothetical protein ACMFMF_005859 [Clarireedia jacksonii]